MSSRTFLCPPQIHPEQEDPLNLDEENAQLLVIVRDLRVIFWTKSKVRAHCKIFLEYQNIGTQDPPKKFGTSRISVSHQLGVVLFSSRFKGSSCSRLICGGHRKFLLGIYSVSHALNRYFDQLLLSILSSILSFSSSRFKGSSCSGWICEWQRKVPECI